MSTTLALYRFNTARKPSVRLNWNDFVEAYR